MSCRAWSRHLFKILFFFAVFSQGAWGETYTWTGAATGDDAGKWSVSENWSPNTGFPDAASDDVVIKGDLPVTVELASDVIIQKLTVNSGGNKEIKINLNGQRFSVATLILNHENTYSHNSSLFFDGNGEVSVGSIDGPNNNGMHTVTIARDVKMEVTNKIWANMTAGSMNFTGDGELHIPSDGINIEYGESKVKIDCKLFPVGESAYKVDFTGDLTSAVTFTLYRQVKGDSNAQSIFYPYTVEIIDKDSTNTESYTLNGVSLSNGDYHALEVPPLSSYLTKTYNLTCSTPIDEGDGIRIKFYSPAYYETGATSISSNAIAVSVYEYINGGISWLGGTSGAETDWHTLGNWVGITDISELETKDITINKTDNLPVISANAKVKSLKITVGASVTMTGGTFETGAIICEDDGKFEASGGEVVFTGASYGGDTYFLKGRYGYSKFNNVTLNDVAGVQPIIDDEFLVSGSLTNNVASGVLIENNVLSASDFLGTGKYVLKSTKNASSIGDTKLIYKGSADSEIAGEVEIQTTTDEKSIIQIINESSKSLTLKNTKANGTPKLKTSGDVVLNFSTGCEFSSIVVDSGSLEIADSGTYKIGCVDFSIIGCVDFSMNQNKLVVQECWFDVTGNFSNDGGGELFLGHSKITVRNAVTWDKISVVNGKLSGTEKYSTYILPTSDTTAKELVVDSENVLEIKGGDSRNFIVGVDSSSSNVIDGALYFACGEFTNNGSTTIGKLVLNPPDSGQTVNLGAGVTVGTLIADGTSDWKGTGAGNGLGGKSITIKGDLTVTEKLTLSGNDAGGSGWLTLNGSGANGTGNWQIDASSVDESNIELKFLAVSNSTSASDFYPAFSYEATSNTTNDKWHFENKWTWKGGKEDKETDWFEAGNWLVNGMAVKYYPGSSSGLSWSGVETVTIPTSPTGNVFPVYSASSEISISGLSIEGNASLTLAGAKNLKVTKTSVASGDGLGFTNAGTLIFASGESWLVDGSDKKINDILNSGTVQYGSGTAVTISIEDFNAGTDLTDIDYSNLIIAENCEAKFLGGALNVASESAMVKGKLVLAASCVVQGNAVYNFSGTSEIAAEGGSGDLTFKTDIVVKDGTFKAAAGTNITCENFKNEGTANCDGNISFSNLFTDETGNGKYGEIEIRGDASGNAVLTGGADASKCLTVSKITNKNTAKKVLFDGNFKFTDTGTFLLSGTSESEKLTVGAGTTGASHFFVFEDYAELSGEFLHFESDFPTLGYLPDGEPIENERRVFAVAKNSSTANSEGKFPKGWIDGEKEYIWIGKTDEHWNEPTNWAGGNSAGVGGTDKKITIASVGGANTNPTLENDVAAEKFYIEAGKNVNFSKFALGCESIELEKNTVLNVTGLSENEKAALSLGVLTNIGASDVSEMAKIYLTDGAISFLADSGDGATLNISNEIYFEKNVSLESFKENSVLKIENPHFVSNSNDVNFSVKGGKIEIDVNADLKVGKLTINNSILKITRVNSLVVMGDFTDDGEFSVLKDDGTSAVLKFEGSSLQKFTQNVATQYGAIEFSSGNGADGTGVSIVREGLKCEKFDLLKGNIIFENQTSIATEIAIVKGEGAILGNAGANATFSGNFFVEIGEIETFGVKLPLGVEKNFVAYSGKIKIEDNSSATLGSISATGGDIIILGENYGVDDFFENVGSGVSGLFAYDSKFRTDASYNNIYAKSNFTETLKPISDFGGKYSASVEIGKSGTAFKAGKNFYANGTKFDGASEWKLEIQNNEKMSDNFSELYNSEIKNCSVVSAKGEGFAILAASENNIDGGGNSGIQFFRPKILSCATKYDDVVEIKFVFDDGASEGNETLCKIENSNGEMAKVLNAGNIGFEGGIFTAAFSDPDCTTPIPNDTDIEGVFYLKANETWNTDATGISAGEDFSTNRSGEHKTAIPSIKLLRATADIFATLMTDGKNRIVNYASANETGSFDTKTKIFTETLDGAGPVLIEVATGRESHSEIAGEQTDYDAHNFLEFKYSETVNFKRPNSDSTTTALDYDATETLQKENVALNENFGNVDGKIDSNGTKIDGLEIKSLAKIEKGKIDWDSKHSEKFAHSFRRLSENTMRITVAGFVDGTVTLGGTDFKNWVGYINSCEMPSGAVSSIETENVTDKAGNKIDAVDGEKNAGLSTHKLSPLTLKNASEIGTDYGNYGLWDTVSPGFAPIRNLLSEWNDWGDFKNAEEYEAIGTARENSGLPYIENVELHLFDDEPTYDVSLDERQWFSRVGWCASKDEIPAQEYATKDVKGGIRTSSLFEASKAFKYTKDLSETSVPSTDFDTAEISNVTISRLFLPASSKYAENSGSRIDDLYLNLALAEKNLDLETTFKIAYDENTAVITDLAGNRLKSKTITSVDRTPPDFSFTVSPAGKKKLFILLSKPIVTENFDFLENDGKTPLPTNGLAGIAKSIEIVKNDGSGAAPESGLAVKSDIPAEIVVKTKKTTGFIVELNQEVTYKDMLDCRVQIRGVADGCDPLSGIRNIEFSFIVDLKGNFMTIGAAHALSDFAVDVINPLYVYDTEHRVLNKGLYGGEDHAVRDFSGSGLNTNRVLAGEDLLMQIATPKEVEGASLFMSVKPESHTISKELDEYMGIEYGIWIPKNSDYEPFKIISEYENENFISETSEKVEGSDTLLNFKISQKSMPENYKDWVPGEKAQFLFGFTDENGKPVEIDHEINGTKAPFYALRLSDPNDITSFDLWYLTLSDIKKQRGNVTILNNVINSNNREQTVINVTMPEAGMLSVYVMTLDGSIVKRLEHSNVTAGEHFYHWNGTNNAGDAVARSIYFIRVVADEIDETRKVLVVK